MHNADSQKKNETAHEPFFNCDFLLRLWGKLFDCDYEKQNNKTKCKRKEKQTRQLKRKLFAYLIIPCL